MADQIKLTLSAKELEAQLKNIEKLINDLKAAGNDSSAFKGLEEHAESLRKTLGKANTEHVKVQGVLSEGQEKNLNAARKTQAAMTSLFNSIKDGNFQLTDLLNVLDDVNDSAEGIKKLGAGFGGVGQAASLIGPYLLPIAGIVGTIVVGVLAWKAAMADVNKLLDEANKKADESAKKLQELKKARADEAPTIADAGARAGLNGSQLETLGAAVRSARAQELNLNADSIAEALAAGAKDINEAILVAYAKKITKNAPNEKEVMDKLNSDSEYKQNILNQEQNTRNFITNERIKTATDVLTTGENALSGEDVQQILEGVKSKTLFIRGNDVISPDISGEGETVIKRLTQNQKNALLQLEQGNRSEKTDYVPVDTNKIINEFPEQQKQSNETNVYNNIFLNPSQQIGTNSFPSYSPTPSNGSSGSTQ